MTMIPTKAFEEMVEKQLTADRDAAFVETKSVTKANAIVLCIVLVGVVGYRMVTWLFFDRAFSIQDLGWHAAVVVLMVVVSRFFGALDWTVRDKRLICTELRVKELLEIHQAKESESRLATIEKRMGRLEQSINLAHGRQKERSLKHQHRIELLFDSLKGRLQANQERVDCILRAIQEQIDFEGSHACAVEKTVLDERAVILRDVAESLKREQVWRNQKAAEYGWPIHPNDMDWLGEVERKTMLRTWSERGPFREEWRNPDI